MRLTPEQQEQIRYAVPYGAPVHVEGIADCQLREAFRKAHA